MAKSYAQVQAQIRRLQAEAEALRAREIEHVVARIRTAIEHYGLTQQQLFGPPSRPARRAAAQARRGPSKTAPAAAPARKAAIKYRDGDDVWSGRGNRPRWLVARLAEGRGLDEFKVA